MIQLLPPVLEKHIEQVLSPEIWKAPSSLHLSTKGIVDVHILAYTIQKTYIEFSEMV